MCRVISQSGGDDLDVFWSIFWFIGKLSLLAVAAFPLFLVGVVIYKIVYEKWRVWQADEITKKAAQIIRLERDGHGLGGFVVSLPSGEMLDLDKDMTEQLIISALTGAQFGAPIAAKAVEGNAPMVELPGMAMIPTQQQDGEVDL